MNENQKLGTIMKELIRFSLPLILSGVLQQLYNWADAFIVGNVDGELSLSAIGVTSIPISFFITTITGFTLGLSVLIAKNFGAKKQDSIPPVLAVFAVILGGVFLLAAAVGSALSYPFMELLHTPADTIDLASGYIRIIFWGLPFLAVYNVYTATLRGLGDSRSTLLLLLISCLTNIVLDIAFVIGLHMGVAGAALATILSQALSAVLVLWVLMRTKDMHRLELRKIRFDGRMFHRIIRIGLPAGLQSVMYTSSNILIQSSVNALGTDTVAAWTAYSKIDSLFWMIVNAFGISITTFVGQNYGAGKMDRVHKGVRTCMEITAGATVLLSVILYNYASICYQLFTTDAQVVVIGEQILHFLVPTYFTYIAIEILSGTLRGIGDSWLPMIISCLGICALRVVWILTAVPLKNDILTIVFSYPLTWTVTSIAFIVYYLFFSRLKIVGRKR